MEKPTCYKYPIQKTVRHKNLNKLLQQLTTCQVMSGEGVNAYEPAVRDGHNCLSFLWSTLLTKYLHSKLSCQHNITLRDPSITFWIIPMSIYMSQLSLFLVSPTNTILYLLTSTATQLSEKQIVPFLVYFITIK